MDRAVSSSGEREELAQKFRTFSALHCGETPLYRAITAAIADSPRVLDMVARSPEGQRVPNLVLAAVHDRLLAGADHELADHYASITGRPSVDPTHAGALFVAFCLEHEAELTAILATRSTQTNEVGRASFLLPALARLRGDGVTRVALVDLGTSAGLNLFVDRYAVTYSNGVIAGDARSSVKMRADLLGPRAPELERGLPDVVSRRGVDQSPIDLGRAEDQRWLLACVWPDQLERFTRLRAAIEIAKHERPDVVRGRLPDDVESLVRGVDPALHVVFLTTWVLAYLSDAERARTDEAIARVGARRDVTWLLSETPPKLPFHVDGFDAHDTVLAETRYRAGARTNTALARVHGHGNFVEWRAD